MDPEPDEPQDPYDDQHTDALIVAYGGHGEFLEAFYRMAMRAGIKLSQPPPGWDDSEPPHPLTGSADPVTWQP